MTSQGSEDILKAEQMATVTVPLFLYIFVYAHLLKSTFIIVSPNYISTSRFWYSS